MNGAWAYVNLALYVLSFICYARYLYGNNQWVGRLATVLLAAGVLAHYVALLERSRWTHTVPYDDLYGSMSLFAWLLGVTYLGLEVYHGQRSVGAFVTLLLIIWIALIMAFAPAAAPAASRARGPLFALHVTLTTLAYAAFGLSFVLSVIYLIQNRVLKARRPGLTFWRFPALDVLDGMSRSSVLVGLVALAVGNVFRIRMAASLERPLLRHGPENHRDPRDFCALCRVLVAGRDEPAGEAREPPRICALNFMLVLFSYTIVNLYLTSFHRYL